MNILFLDHAPVMGGAEIVTMNLAAALDRARYSPRLLTSDNAAMLAQLRARDIPAHVVYLERINLFHPRGARNLARAVRAVVRIARSEKIDVIQSTTARMHIVGALAAPIARVPLVWHLMDVTLPRRVVRVFGTSPRRVTALSSYIAEMYRGALKNVEVIYPGVVVPRVADADAIVPPVIASEAKQSPSRDLDARRAASSQKTLLAMTQTTLRADALALRDKFKIPRDAPLILNVGRLIRAKGQDVLLGAVAQIAPETRAHIVLVGAAEDVQYVQELRELREKLGVRVTLTGHRDDVARWIAASDICVYSAVEPEGLGMVILEAMAQGKPVIASAIGGARELVRENETGLRVPPRDADALARALSRLIQDRDEARRMGAAGRARMVSEFSMQNQVARYQEIYDALQK